MAATLSSAGESTHRSKALIGALAARMAPLGIPDKRRRAEQRPSQRCAARLRQS
ncbi:MAG TPA: hypothetical protein VJ908_02910 [Wenzhouxiangellaceae bacterium]|nr:hypothetical protein [Wenzhouxiangellaceae bacterium]